MIPRTRAIGPEQRIRRRLRSKEKRTDRVHKFRRPFFFCIGRAATSDKLPLLFSSSTSSIGRLGGGAEGTSSEGSFAGMCDRQTIRRMRSLGAHRNITKGRQKEKRNLHHFLVFPFHNSNGHLPPQHSPMTHDKSASSNNDENTLVYLDIEIGDQEFKATSWDL